ncbi:MAG: hypothetical protein J7K31_04455 [Candidatus Aenigmarchaeota archaeon]|nr:hypothetical protein [Candidatus Aenigmarchaeota archaeon]
MDRILIASFIIGIIAISGCVQQQTGQTKAEDTVKEQATELCIAACQSAKESGVSLDNGPCLSEEIVEDWVCDIAHNPRQPIDNEPQNQCSSYRTGKTHHFVELDTDCELIRAI